LFDEAGEDRGADGVFGVEEGDGGELAVVAEEEPLVAFHHGHDGGGEGELAGFIENGGVEVGGFEPFGIEGEGSGTDDVGAGVFIEFAGREILESGEGEVFGGEGAGDFGDGDVGREEGSDFGEGVVDGAVGEAGDEDAFTSFDEFFDEAGEGVGFAGAGRTLDEVEGAGGERDGDGIGLGFVEVGEFFEVVEGFVIDFAVDEAFLFAEEDGEDLFATVGEVAKILDGVEVEGGEIDEVFIDGPAGEVGEAGVVAFWAGNGEALGGEAHEGGGEECAFGVILAEADGLFFLEDREVFAGRLEMDEALGGVDGGDLEATEGAAVGDAFGEGFVPELVQVVALKVAFIQDVAAEL